jgi:hypothetical protein
LLFLLPELDANREPCDWLAMALRTTGLTGAPRELYRRAIGGDPAEVLSERCRQLLELPVRAGLIADLAEWRWQAAGRLGQWQTIAADLGSLRSHILHDDEETWARLLMAAVEQLIAIPDDSAERLARQCWEEVGQLNHLQRTLADGLDRLELLLDVAKGWRLLRGDPHVPQALVQLIPLSWTRPFVEVRPDLLAYLADVVRQPREALIAFEHIMCKAPAVLPQFGHLLALLEDTVPPLPDAGEEVRELARAYLGAEDFSDYHAYRLRLLDWCVQEALLPEEVAMAIADETLALAAKVPQDWALRCVCWACRLFWA